MILARLTVAREGYYGPGHRCDPSKPLRATVEVIGDNGKTELNLSPEVSARVVALIADELAAEARKVAEIMTASFINAVAPSLTKAAQSEKFIV